jgi:hypothetical protein
MRRSLLPLLSAAVLLLPSAVLRAADDDAKAIIAKAIKAHGGEEKLMKHKATQMKGKGKADTPVGEIEFKNEVSTMMPDKVKDVSEFEVMGQKMKVVSLIVGDKVSVEANGTAVPLPDKAKESIKETAYQMRVGKMVPLLTDKDFELSTLGETKVNGKPAVGVQVKSKGHKDINMYFDKDSGLIAKVEKRSVDPMSGNEFTEERVINEYQKVDGMQVPKKLTVLKDGKKSVELEIEDVKFLDKLDDSEFGPIK